MDVRKLAKWFSAANSEPWDVARVTGRDITDFRSISAEKEERADGEQALLRCGSIS